MGIQSCVSGFISGLSDYDTNNTLANVNTCYRFSRNLYHCFRDVDYYGVARVGAVIGLGLVIARLYNAYRNFNVFAHLSSLQKKNLKQLFSDKVKAGKIAQLRSLLNIKVPINSPGPNGSYPIIEACKNKRWNVVRFLLKHNAKVNVGLKKPLLYASEAGRDDLVNTLLKQGANCQATTSTTGENALHLACTPAAQDKVNERKRMNVVNSLLAKGLSPTTKDNKNRTAIHQAAKGNTLILKLLLKHKSVNKKILSQKDDDGHTALEYAASADNIENFNLLLKTEGLKMNELGKRGDAMLHIAKGRVLKALLKTFNPNKYDKSGLTPIHTATKRGDVQAVEVLIHSKNVDLEKLTQGDKKNPGQTIAHLAVALENQKKSAELIELFISKNLYNLLNKPNSEDLTPLHLAFKKRNRFAYHLLVPNSKIHLNIEDKKKLKPIDYAVIYGLYNNHVFLLPKLYSYFAKRNCKFTYDNNNKDILIKEIIARYLNETTPFTKFTNIEDIKKLQSDLQQKKETPLTKEFKQSVEDYLKGLANMSNKMLNKEYRETGMFFPWMLNIGLNYHSDIEFMAHRKFIDSTTKSSLNNIRSGSGKIPAGLLSVINPKCSSLSSFCNHLFSVVCERWEKDEEKRRSIMRRNRKTVV